MIVYLVCALWGGAWGLWASVQAWRTGWVNKTGKRPEWWPLGDPGWLAYSRGYPCGYVAVMCGVIAIFLRGEAQHLASLAMLIGLAVVALVVAFSQPRFIIPPTRRRDRGLASSLLKRPNRDSDR